MADTRSHTQTRQNISPTQADLEPDQEEQNADSGQNVDLYQRNENAQTGGSRAPANTPAASRNRNTEPASVAREGSVTTRTPGGTQQGISSHSADEEAARQQKVVKDREDAQAGVNHNR